LTSFVVIIVVLAIIGFVGTWFYENTHAFDSESLFDYEAPVHIDMNDADDQITTSPEDYSNSIFNILNQDNAWALNTILKAQDREVGTPEFNRANMDYYFNYYRFNVDFNKEIFDNKKVLDANYWNGIVFKKSSPESQGYLILTGFNLCLIRTIVLCRAKTRKKPLNSVLGRA